MAWANNRLRVVYMTNAIGGGRFYGNSGNITISSVNEPGGFNMYDYDQRHKYYDQPKYENITFDQASNY